MRRKISRLAALLSAGLLLFGSVGAASAAPAKSFDVAWCFEFPRVVATVTWSGYRVNTIRIEVNDQINFIGWTDAIEPPARSGTHITLLGIENDFPFATVDIRLNNRIWASEAVAAPGGDWAGLPTC